MAMRMDIERWVDVANSRSRWKRDLHRGEKERWFVARQKRARRKESTATSEVSLFVAIEIATPIVGWHGHYRCCAAIRSLGITRDWRMPYNKLNDKAAQKPLYLKIFFIQHWKFSVITGEWLCSFVILARTSTRYNIKDILWLVPVAYCLPALE